MRNLGIVTLTLAASAVQAAAADLPQRPAYAPAPVVAPVYSWTGFYLGGNLGGAWSSTTVTSNISGANWKSPIGDFKMTIDKGAANRLVSFCGDGVTKISPTQFQVHHANFTPTKNVAVLILMPLSQ